MAGKEESAQSVSEQLMSIKNPMEYIRNLIKGKQGKLTAGNETFRIRKLDRKGNLSSVSPDLLTIEITVSGKKHNEAYIIGKEGMIEMSFDFPPLVDVPTTIHNFTKKHPTVKLPFKDDQKARSYARALVLADYIRRKVEQ